MTKLRRALKPVFTEDKLWLIQNEFNRYLSDRHLAFNTGGVDDYGNVYSRGCLVPSNELIDRLRELGE